MKIKSLIYYFLIFSIIPIIYWIFSDWIVSQWNQIESLITIFSYWTAIIFYLYLSDIKFYFFVKRIILFFKFDHTVWILSVRYILDSDSNSNIIGKLQKLFFTYDCVIKKQELDFLEILWKNKYILNFRVQNFDNEYQLHFYTSKIVVPTLQNKIQISELSELLENIESLINFKSCDDKIYEIDLEYNEKSPYYSFWIRKLPEELIYNFNCKIKLPNSNNDIIAINKNHLTIKTSRYTKLFDLTKDYVLLHSV